jgi:hypothetical protein
LQQLVPCRARCRSLSGSIFEGPTRASPRVAQSGPFTSWAFDHGSWPGPELGENERAFSQEEIAGCPAVGEAVFEPRDKEH